jgi:hypothetical protein
MILVGSFVAHWRLAVATFGFNEGRSLAAAQSLLLQY